MSASDDQLQVLAALNEPTRAALYRFVANAHREVSRDEAADALGIPREKAAFHLDRLAASGLLETIFRRLGERSGPGAGRPSMLYRRAETTVTASVPPREYQLAGEVMASALNQMDDAAAQTAIENAARAKAAEIARDYEGVMPLLSGLGFEPKVEDNGNIALQNCPFHSLAKAFTEQTCAMNKAFIDAVLDTFESEGYRAELAPHEKRCCVCLVAQS